MPADPPVGNTEPPELEDDLTVEPQDVLQREHEYRGRAGLAAIAGGIMLLSGSLITSIALSGVPEVTVLDALGDAAGTPPPDGGLRTAAALYLHDRTWGLTLGQLLLGLGGLLASGALVFVFLAARARRPRMGQGALIALAIGGVAYLIGTLVRQIARAVELASFADSSDHSTQAAHDAMQPTSFIVGSLFQYVGQVALAVGFVVVALNAMRLGLLTRFMGILGVISGVMFVLQVTALPVVQSFWLVSLGAMILGRWQQMVPPAWKTGRAEPWPTRQETLEARARQEESA